MPASTFPIFIVFSLIGFCWAFFDFQKDENGLIKWNGLRVTWGREVGGQYFSPLPRTSMEATKQGFEMISDCDVNSKWRGARYMKDNDPAVILLYDVNGYIAGIQNSIPNDLNNSYPAEAIKPPFLEDGNRYVVTAYFLHPDKICTDGRDDKEFSSQGTGTNLYIQNGTVPETDIILIPRYRKDMEGTKWTLGTYMETMGLHYWYDNRKDLNCLETFPVAVLYHQEQLTGFAWALVGDLDSPRYEHPPSSFLSLLMVSVPDCVKETPHFSSIHVFLTDIKKDDDVDDNDDGDEDDDGSGSPAFHVLDNFLHILSCIIAMLIRYNF